MNLTYLQHRYAKAAFRGALYFGIFTFGAFFGKGVNAAPEPGTIVTGNGIIQVVIEGCISDANLFTLTKVVDGKRRYFTFYCKFAFGSNYLPKGLSPLPKPKLDKQVYEHKIGYPILHVLQSTL